MEFEVHYEINYFILIQEFFCQLIQFSIFFLPYKNLSLFKLSLLIVFLIVLWLLWEI